jgi:hypothetical protein
MFNLVSYYDYEVIQLFLRKLTVMRLLLHPENAYSIYLIDKTLH